ncbi:hypothetical protein [Roseovarius sp. D0-M9]|uniref:hypothetical protein n=1 Tax=Roseovarius sp. D0-M9 TaxID=3127117 RepID=UPI0030102A88
MDEKYEAKAVYLVRFGGPVAIPGTDVQLMPRHRHRITGAVLTKLLEGGANVRSAEPE